VAGGIISGPWDSKHYQCSGPRELLPLSISQKWDGREFFGPQWHLLKQGVAMNDAHPINRGDGVETPKRPALPTSLEPDDAAHSRRYRLTHKYSIEAFESESPAIAPDDVTLDGEGNTYDL
jgi:hypothetical protein